jgi:hypothetical protein
VVGDAVELRVGVSGQGGRPQYRLFGAEPVLAGDTSARTASHFGTVVYDLHAAQSGAASLVMSVTYETELGCPGNFFHGSASARSEPFVVRVGEGSTPASPTPTPTATPSCPTPTPIQCHPAGFTQQCEVVPTAGDPCLRLECRCVECPPCTEGEAYTGGINSCRCSVDTASPPGCAGDCDDDERVMVNELILGIAIALGADEIGACEAADSDRNGAVAIDDLTRAVGRAMQGCGGV